MKTLKKTRTINSGNIWKSYFAHAKQNDLDTVIVTKKKPFTGEEYEDIYYSFQYKGKTYAVTAFDYYTDQVTSLTNIEAIKGLRISEVV